MGQPADLGPLDMTPFRPLVIEQVSAHGKNLPFFPGTVDFCAWLTFLGEEGLAVYLKGLSVLQPGFAEGRQAGC